MRKDFISIKDLSLQEIGDIFDLTSRLKKDKAGFKVSLEGKTLALIFQKPSNRTRVSFEVGMYQLGGNTIYLAPDEINLGVREPIKDVARTLSRYVEGVVLRTFEHRNIIELAEYASVPVINGLSDFEHPCQALSDLYTVRERLKNTENAIFCYVGDGNNVCNSLIFACAKIGLNIRLACPKGYEPKKEILTEAEELAKAQKSFIHFFSNPFEAVKDADVIYTDVWVSMGQEKEALKRRKVFKDFQLNAGLVKMAKPKALIMHCLPAHRGEEIADEIIEGPNSIVFDQAENRMHVQKAVLIKLLGRLKAAREVS